MCIGQEAQTEHTVQAWRQGQPEDRLKTPEPVKLCAVKAVGPDKSQKSGRAVDCVVRGTGLLDWQISRLAS